MKTSIFFILFSILSAAFAQSQHGNSAIAEDSILNLIETHLPDGWTMELTNHELKVLRTEKITIIQGDCDSILADSIETYKHNDTAGFYFLVDEKWSAERLLWTKEYNDSLKLRLDLLPQEFGITHLYDPVKSTRSKIVYTGNTQAEKDKIEAFYKRRAEIAKNIIRIPNFYTTNYSLFVHKQIGKFSPKTCVFPKEASMEANTVYILFLEYCENPLNQ